MESSSTSAEMRLKRSRGDWEWAAKRFVNGVRQDSSKLAEGIKKPGIHEEGYNDCFYQGNERRCAGFNQ